MFTDNWVARYSSEALEALGYGDEVGFFAICP